MNCFRQEGEKRYQQGAAAIMLSFSVEGYCTLTVKLRNSAYAILRQTASEDSKSKTVLLHFYLVKTFLPLWFD